MFRQLCHLENHDSKTVISSSEQEMHARFYTDCFHLSNIDGIVAGTLTKKKHQNESGKM